MVTAEYPLIHEAAQAKIQSLLDEMTRTSKETGLQVAAYRDGELVIDAWSGIANPATREPVTHDTLFTAFSCTKGVTATVIHQLVEAGKLDYDTPVVHYWREFAAQGKASVTVRHVLTHEAGIPQLPKGITPEKLVNWDFMIHEIEAMKPLWQPGTKTGYHGITYGFILGELAQRVDGRPFGQIVQDDICAPLGINDLFIGMPPELEARIATIGGSRAPFLYLPPIFLVKRTIPAAVEPGPVWNRSDMRQAVIPAGNMVTTARSLAKHYAALIGDGVDGVRLLTPERVRIASALQTDGRDQVFFGGRIRKGLGYWVGGAGDDAFGTRTSVFGHTGAGSLIGFADPEYCLSVALVKNQMTWRFGNDTDVIIAHAVREALAIPD